MGKILEVLHSGKASTFKLTKISRAKLYGSKKRVPVDAQGEECARVALTHDGRYILPAGGTAMFYLDNQGDVVERNQLREMDADEEVEAPENLNAATPPEALQVVTAAEVLEYSITRAYVLEPVFICVELEKSLSSGAIYCLPDCNGRRAFLLGNETGYFLLIGEHTGFEFIGLAEADISPPDFDAEDMNEDLDFAMY